MKSKIFKCCAITISILCCCAGVAYNFLNPEQKIDLYRKYYLQNLYRYTDITNLNSKQLRDAIAKAKQQPWVIEQIRADLAPFKNDISVLQINDAYLKFQHIRNRLVKFTVRERQVIIETSDAGRLQLAKTPMKAVINMLAKYKLIADCTFILAMDDYLHYIPEHSLPVPIFSFAKDMQNPIEKDTILVPDWQNLMYGSALRDRISFAQKIFGWNKKREIMHWRGSLADSMLQRKLLVEMQNEFDFLDVGFVATKNPLVDKLKNEETIFVPFMEPEYSIQNKYLISLDGSRCSWLRLIWALQSHSVMIKPNSSQVQWFYRGLQPYVNYVPLPKVDTANISIIYTWLRTHDADCKIIAENAASFAAENLQQTDMLAYYVLLLEEYTKILVS